MKTSTRVPVKERSQYKAKFILGKLKSKYLILDVLTYACIQYNEAYELLHYSCRSLRELYAENNYLLFNSKMIKPKIVLDTAYLYKTINGSQIYISNQINFEVFFNEKLCMLTNHEIVVGSPEELKGALSFLY